MTTLATITAVIAVFAVVQVQEWRQLTRNNRYAVKLSKARANIRLAECASVAKHERRKVGVA